ncbi:MAG: zinc-ribbon domain-containing protein [Armatimonadetes bacterium]|nr:zinc-ribbon domain-containing protein [Armatimonadota bacterium]
MSRFCPQCGHRAKESANFCSKCGARFRQKETYQPSGGAIVPAPTSAPATSWPTAPAQPEADPTYVPPPQYWESYDYPSDSPDVGYSSSSYSYPYDYPGVSRPTDASRPLPPLSFGPSGGPPAGARERAKDIARNFSLWAAGIVLFPVPFSDLVLLMPVQTAMVISIGKAYGVKDPPEKMLAHIAAACGASVFGQITTLFVANLIPIIGKLVSAPFVYGWTYGLGEVAMRYFESQGELDRDEMKQLFKKVSRDATRAFRPTDVSNDQSFDHLREHLSEEDYQKLRMRFGQQ